MITWNPPARMPGKEEKGGWEQAQKVLTIIGY